MASILKSPPILLRLPSIRAPEPRRVLLGFGLRRPNANLSFSAAAFPERSGRFQRFLRFSAVGETTEEVEERNGGKQLEDSESEVEDKDTGTDGAAVESEDKTTSAVMASLQLYKEALSNDDQTAIGDIESYLLSIEDEKESLAKQVASLSEELSIDKDRILRISADFDNFRKRTERDRLSLMSNAQGEVVESLLPVLDNFERAKSQIKVESEGEEKINNSYQSIYKQFVEIIDSLGVEAVETVGSTFDPMLHEAIMRDESTEFEEGIILQEFRKGFKLGERLLRPSMVKVSAGPGPTKTDEEAVLPTEEESSTIAESNTEDVDESGDE